VFPLLTRDRVLILKVEGMAVELTSSLRKRPRRIMRLGRVREGVRVRRSTRADREDLSPPASAAPVFIHSVKTGLELTAKLKFKAVPDRAAFPCNIFKRKVTRVAESTNLDDASPLS
jgi:hypothetical protein